MPQAWSLEPGSSGESTARRVTLLLYQTLKYFIWLVRGAVQILSYSETLTSYCPHSWDSKTPTCAFSPSALSICQIVALRQRGI